MSLYYISPVTVTSNQLAGIYAQVIAILATMEFR